MAKFVWLPLAVSFIACGGEGLEDMDDALTVSENYERLEKEDVKAVPVLSSKEGINLGTRIVRAQQVLKFAPVVILHPDEPYRPTSIENLLKGAKVVVANSGEVKATNPSQQDLLKFTDPSYQIYIDKEQFGGMPFSKDRRVTAPMYVAVQEVPDRSELDLNFIFLYGYNGSQTVRVCVPSNDFNASLDTLGEHEGDIESLTVRVSSDFDHVVAVRFEAHGNHEWRDANNVNYFGGTHPVARAAYHGHGTYSDKEYGAPVAWKTIESHGAIGFGVDFIDILHAGGPRWQPFEIRHGTVLMDGDKTIGLVFIGRNEPPTAVGNGQLVFIGLDDNKQPRNDQAWVAFAGRIGGSQKNKFKGVSGIGKSLNFLQLAYTTTIAGIATQFIKEGADGDGPTGLRHLGTVTPGSSYRR